MNYVIPEELAQALLNYIAEPHKELLRLIQGLQTLEEEKPVVEEKPEAKSKAKS